MCTVCPHTIDTGDAHPIKQPVRRLPYHQRDALRQVLDDLLASDTISPSSSPWAAPIVLVKKKDGSPRLCVDYCKLNKVTRADAYPCHGQMTSLIHFWLHYIHYSGFSFGYWQIAMDEGDKCKTAFTTPLGLYEFNVMPMGCTNGPATFQRVMEHVLHAALTSPATGSMCRVFFGDIAVAASDHPGCLSRLRQVLTCLRQHHLKLRFSKCHFLQPKSASWALTSALMVSKLHQPKYRQCPHGPHHDPCMTFAASWAWRRTTVSLFLDLQNSCSFACFDRQVCFLSLVSCM